MLKQFFSPESLIEPSGEPKRSNRKKISLIALVCVLLVITAAVGANLLGRRQTAGGKLRISFAAAAPGLNGIEKKSRFILKASRNLTAEQIKKNFKFEPATDFEIKPKKSFFSPLVSFLSINQAAAYNETYEIVPTQDLTEGVVYQIKTATSTDLELDHNYSWAFKVKDGLSFKETLPADEAAGVPVNTGIEITLNRLDIAKDAENFFEIEPKIVGRFEVGLDKIVFIPTGDLQAKTLYKVTLKKGYQAGDSSEQLTEDKSFSFETAPPATGEGQSGIYWNGAYSEMTPDKASFLEAYGSGTSSEAIIYKYATTGAFLADYYKFQNRAFNWSKYNQDVFVPSEAESVAKFEPKLLKRNENDGFGLIQLSQKLAGGLYVIGLSTGENSDYAFVRVSPLAYYYTEVNGDGLIWAYDFSGKKPFAGVNLSLVGQDGKERELGQTDQNGLVKFDSSAPSDDIPKASLIFKGADSGETAVPDIGGQLERRKNYYQGYLNTDRYAYRLTDKLHFWGVVRGRSFDLKQKKVRVSLGGYAEQEVMVSPFDTIEGELDFEGLPSGFLNLTVSYNDETITSSGIEIFPFEKPLYKIEVTADKNFSVTGEAVKTKVAVSFFDGTPVKNMELKYTINWRTNSEGRLVTDDNGQATISFTPDYYFTESSDQYSDYWTTYPQSLRFTVRPALPEEGEIWGETYTNVYGPKLLSQAEQSESNNSLVFKTKLNELNFATSSEDGIVGQPAAGRGVSVQIIKYYYVEVPAGETYDPIEKIKIKNYNYEIRKQTIRSADGVTDEKGEWSVEIDKKEAVGNGYLRAIFRTTDDGGKIVKSSAESYNYYPNNSTYLNLVNLDLKKKDFNNYKIGDQVRLEAQLTGSRKPVDSRTLIIRFQEGLRGAELIDKDQYTDTFADNYPPSMSYRAIKLMPDGFLESDIVTASFNDEVKKLDVEISPDKDRYKPREKINLDINIKDQNKKGVKAVANVAAVDEALFNITPWGYGGDILATLYSDIYAYPRSYSTRYVTDFKTGAEKGGCFVAGTLITMADGGKKSIENVRVGDEIKTRENETSNTLRESIVQGVSAHQEQGYLIINGRLKLTLEHRILLNGEWRPAAMAKIGDYLSTEGGKSEAIKEIAFVKAPGIRVYNIIAGRYHTYFADGYYVHNAEKGGGGDTRNYFEDTPLYQQLQSDDSGNIKTSFTAPDNLTSWRVTVNAYNTPEFMAGSNFKLVPVGLPLFVDAVLARRYLAGDSPEIKLRAFGSGYQPGKPVEFSLTADSLKINFVKSTTAGEVSLPLGKLPLGKHKLIIGVKQGELKDSMERNIEVVENYFKRLQAESQLLDQTTVQFKGNPHGLTDLLFVDDGKGKYYGPLMDLSWQGSLRADVAAAAYLASKALNDNFYNGQDYFGADLDLGKYQNPNADGGLALFPYSQVNYGLTAMLADGLPDKLDKASLENGLSQKLSSQTAGIEDIGPILYGLSAVGRPELPFINYLSTAASTTLKTRIYLALALYKAGDWEGARAIYANDLLPRLTADQANAYLEAGNSATENIKSTALLGLLSSYLESGTDNEILNKILTYLAGNQPKDDTVALEVALILKNEIAKAGIVDAAFNYATKNRQGAVDLSRGQTFQLTLSADELSTLSVSDLKGSVRAITYLEEFTDPGTLNKSNLLALKRTYLVDGKETVDFKEGDLVEVRLDPTFTDLAPDDNYQLVDYLPSGLKPVAREYNLSVQSDDSCNPIWYPAKITDDAIYFNIGKWFLRSDTCQHRTINYHARVINKGEYKAQPAMIESLNDTELLNIAPETTVNIK